jgi:hypothetical protein
MIALQFFMLCVVMVLAWTCLRVLFRNEPKLQAMGLFGCTHKTVAMGVPLINAIYESNPMVGLYTLPLLIWHHAAGSRKFRRSKSCLHMYRGVKKKLVVHYKKKRAQMVLPAVAQMQMIQR